MTTRPRRRLFLVLIPLAALVGIGLRLAQELGVPPPPLVIPMDDPLIEPKEISNACALHAKFTLAKMYGVDGQQNRFREAKKITGQTWRVTGEIRAYTGKTFHVYPYECMNGEDTIGVNIHPQTRESEP